MAHQIIDTTQHTDKDILGPGLGQSSTFNKQQENSPRWVDAGHN